MKDIDKLIHGKEIDLEEMEGRADQAQIHKVCELNNLGSLLIFVHSMLVLASDAQWFNPQHYKITGPELGISSLADAITCRIASRDAL